MVRVRFAPSPTGHLHVGAARTALFNWLFACHNKGKFILRIEDTDMARSSEDMIQGIIDGLKWLGIDWQEGPFFQSKRIEVYRRKATELIRQGFAYYCYCLPEEIKDRRASAPSNGKDWKYDRRCYYLSSHEKKQFESSGKSKAIRFLVPQGDIKYTDLIHGPISVQSQNLEDFVLLRSDGLPTYHLSVVVDDAEQRITHIIRGDDHISNTPKQILLYQAFQKPIPEFAHLALILDPDRKKLSKRHGVTSVLKFKEEGYLPLALFNFLAQMSWMPGGKEDIYPIEEMIKVFSLKKLSKGSPVFDLSKLEWLNGRLLSQMKAGNIASLVIPEFKSENLWRQEFDDERREWFLRLLDLLKERSRSLKEFPVRARPFISDEFSYDSEAVDKYLKDEKLERLLKKLGEDFKKMKEFKAENIESVLRLRAEKEKVKAALLIHALRVLVLGEKVSPGIFDVLELVGKEKAIERMGNIQRALKSV